jgi:hypothetical protein
MTNHPTETLLAEVDRFLERTGMSPTAFGKNAVRDPNLVRCLRAGRESRFPRVQRIRAFIASHGIEA